MEKGQAEKGKGVVEEGHAAWLAAKAEHGKDAVAAEEEDHSPWLSEIAAEERVHGAAAASNQWVDKGEEVVAPKQKIVTNAQIRRKKKKNRKNRLRAERKANGGKIWSPADVQTFDESDSDDEDELSEDIADDDEDRDRKSRAVLKKLKDGVIPYLNEAGEYKCPWCFRAEMPKDYLGMLQHATYFGSGSVRHQAHLKAKHAAYGVFLLKHLPK